MNRQERLAWIRFAVSASACGLFLGWIFAGMEHGEGVDFSIGILIFAVTIVFFVFSIVIDLRPEMNLQEKKLWKRWLALGFATAYLGWRFFGKLGFPSNDYDWLIIVAVFFSSASSLFPKIFPAHEPESDKSESDEHDIAIQSNSHKSGYLTLLVILLLSPFLVRFGVDPSQENHRPEAWLNTYLFACIGFALWVQHSVAIHSHWQDRQ